MANQRVWVAMSGGVDSSVAAAWALRERREVQGVTLDLGRGEPDRLAIDSAARVCARLGIPHRVLDVSREFDSCVVDKTAKRYAEGHTPNPCVECNALIKFGLLADAAAAEGADMATGHYARIIVRDGGPWLARSKDPHKDQSYFLYRVPCERLAHVMFPLGEVTKTDVRTEAASLGLAEMHTKESQDACFVGPGGYPELVAARYPQGCRPGPLITSTGETVGTHRGICRYTVGQRRRIGIASSDPLYVIALDGAHNAVVVGDKTQLEVSRIRAIDPVWHAAPGVRTLFVKCRYNSPLVRAQVTYDGEALVAEVEEPLFGVAPGQSLVCYDADTVLGGGIIEEAL
ncbi:MAG: tRNA 2-thiouridine(34) synthase MnmA [Coriobacteriales bacterium]